MEETGGISSAQAMNKYSSSYRILVQHVAKKDCCVEKM
jgi:hypothetical protein